jgi:hypothetical protein
VSRPWRPGWSSHDFAEMPGTAAHSIPHCSRHFRWDSEMRTDSEMGVVVRYPREGSSGRRLSSQTKRCSQLERAPGSSSEAKYWRESTPPRPALNPHQHLYSVTPQARDGDRGQKNAPAWLPINQTSFTSVSFENLSSVGLSGLTCFGLCDFL